MADRTFQAMDRNGNLCEFELIIPRLAEENEGERQYRVAYSKALVEGIFPKEKLREIMRQHEMWTDNDDKILKKTVGKIAILQIELQKAETEGNKEECVRIAKEMSELRHRMWELFLIQQSVYMNSAEGIAEMIKTESIMAACTHVKSTNKRYWNNYADYVLERDLNTKSTVYSKVIGLQANILDEVRLGLMADYPENQHLKTVEDRMLDREVQEEVVKELKTRANKAIKKERKKRDKMGSKTSESGKNDQDTPE